MACITYLPDTLQFSDYDCGVTCVQTVLTYYGEDINELKLLKKIKPRKKNGTKTEHMLKYIHGKGLRTYAGSMTKSYINNKYYKI